MTNTEVAQDLLSKTPEIIQKWLTLVHEKVPAAKAQNRTVLLDGLPLLLDRMAARFVQGDSAMEPLDTAHAEEHGESRTTMADYSLEQVIQEYHLLRIAIMTSLDGEVIRNLDQIRILHESIDWAILKATSRYTHLLQQVILDRSEELERADVRKNRFLTTLAHELRTPLSAVKNSLYVLENAHLEERLQRAVDIGGRQTTHLERMINELTDVSRVALGKVELNLDVVDLNAVAELVEQTMKPFFAGKRQTLTLSLESNAVIVRADATRIEQVVTNLLRNANKYTEEGGEVVLSVSRAGGDAIIGVKDTGCGIREELLPFVFDIYTQADCSDVQSQGGLGIGLNLVRRLVELHGGSVEATSGGEGQGAEFLVRWPLMAA